MSINLTGGNFASNAAAASFYNSSAIATWLSWFQIFDVTQTNRGIFTLANFIDENNIQQLEHAIGPAAPGGRLIAVCNTGGPPGTNTIWTKDAALTPGMHCFMSCFDGTAPAGAANRWRQAFNGVEDTANGVFVGAPGAALGFGVTHEMQVGSFFVAGGAHANYIGCCCMHAGWVAGAITDAAEIFALGPGGDLSLSSLGLPINWYRLQANLLDSGSVPRNLTSQGAPPVPFGCPGGDPACSGVVPLVVTPADADFYLRMRRRS